MVVLPLQGRGRALAFDRGDLAAALEARPTAQSNGVGLTGLEGSRGQGLRRVRVDQAIQVAGCPDVNGHDVVGGVFAEAVLLAKIAEAP
jgi:hypothetical protein